MNSSLNLPLIRLHLSLYKRNRQKNDLKLVKIGLLTISGPETVRIRSPEADERDSRKKIGLNVQKKLDSTFDDLINLQGDNINLAKRTDFWQKKCIFNTM